MLTFIHVSTQTFRDGVKSELLTGKIKTICKKAKLTVVCSFFFFNCGLGFRLSDPLLSFYFDV